MAILEQSYHEWFATYEKCLGRGLFPQVPLKKKEDSTKTGGGATNSYSNSKDSSSNDKNGKTYSPGSFKQKYKLVQHKDGWINWLVLCL